MISKGVLGTYSTPDLHDQQGGAGDLFYPRVSTGIFYPRISKGVLGTYSTFLYLIVRPRLTFKIYIYSRCYISARLKVNSKMTATCFGLVTCAFSDLYLCVSVSVQKSTATGRGLDLAQSTITIISSLAEGFI